MGVPIKTGISSSIGVEKSMIQLPLLDAELGEVFCTINLDTAADAESLAVEIKQKSNDIMDAIATKTQEKGFVIEAKGLTEPGTITGIKNHTIPGPLQGVGQLLLA